MACAIQCSALLLLVIPGALGKCQYSRWPDAPSNSHLHRVCARDVFSRYSAESVSRSRRCEIPVDLPEGRQLTVDTCEAACSGDGRCAGFVIRSPWSPKPEIGSCWLVYEKDLPRTAISTKGGLQLRKKRTFVKEFCDCEARYVHVERQSRIAASQIEDEIHVFKTRCREHIRSLNRTLAATQRKRDGLVQRNEEKDGDWLRKLRHKVTRPLQKLERQIRELEDKLKSATEACPHFRREIAKKERELRKERKRLGKLGVLEGISGIYQWFPPEPAHQRMMKLSNIQFGNIFLSDNKQNILYRCDKNSDKARSTWDSKSNWYIVTLDQILQSLEVKDFGEVKSMGPWAMLRLYLGLTCLGYRLQDAEGGGAQVCMDNDGKNCLPVTTLNTWDPDVGCHKSSTKAAKYRELLIVQHMERDVSDEAMLNESSEEGDVDPFSGAALDEPGANDSDAAAGGEDVLPVVGRRKVLMGCPITHGEESSQVMGWADWVAKHPGILRQALEGIKVYSLFRSDISWGEASTSYVVERLNVILKHFVPVIAAISAIDSTRDEWVKIACSALMLKNIQKMQGIFPKLAQNLALRPDMIADDYAREKLKETQSENPQHGREFVEKFVLGTGAKVRIYTPATQEMFDPLFSTRAHEMHELPLFDAIRYERLLAAGSVGQVLLYRVVSDDLKQYLRREGVAQDDHVILKVVFEETENSYKSDWTMLEVLFGLADRFHDLGAVASFWRFLKPMRESIFNEFDLQTEGLNTERGRKSLHEFTELVRKGRIEGLSGVRFTAPLAVMTSSKYVLLQSIAPGVELKDYLIEAVGLPGPLTAWRQTIYRGMMHLYGFMVLQKGFFQADPHGGNWFVDERSGKELVVTLIDWGGVEELAPGSHCRLAEFYYRARAEAERLSRCSSVEIVAGADLAEWGDDIEGLYEPAGISFFTANEERGMPSLLMGFAAAYKYKAVTRNGRERLLRFDGDTWHLSEWREQPNSEAAFADVMRYEARETKTVGLGDPVSLSQKGPAPPGGGRWVRMSGESPAGSLLIERGGGGECRPRHVLANEGANKAYVEGAFSDLGRFLGLDPAPEIVIPMSALASATLAFDSDPALLARVSSDVRRIAYDARAKGTSLPHLAPRLPPDLVLLLRCLGVFQGMLLDVLKQNIPPKLPQEYLESFLDPSGDSLFRHWAGYAEAGGVLDSGGKCAWKDQTSVKA